MDVDTVGQESRGEDQTGAWPAEDEIGDLGKGKVKEKSRHQSLGAYAAKWVTCSETAVKANIKRDGASEGTGKNGYSQEYDQGYPEPRI